MGWKTKRKSKQSRRPAPRRFGIERLESRVACAVDFDFAFVSSGESATASAAAVDAQGDVYVAGEFYGKVDFDPSAAEYSLTADGEGEGDIFLAKYTSDGQFLWARQLGTSATVDRVGGLAVDASGNVILGGDEGRYTFNPDFGWSYDSDAFIAKFDAGGGLIFQQFVTEGEQATMTGLGVDGSGAIYYSGIFNNGDTSSGYFGKLSASGSMIYTKTFSGNGVMPEDIAVDSQGNLAIVGTFRNWIDLDPGDNSATFEGSYSNLFLVRLDSNGNYQWGTTITSGESYMGAANVAFTPSGGVVMTGTFTGTVEFDPSGNKYVLTSDTDTENSAIFALKFDAAGSFSWASVLGQYGEAGPTGLRVDSSGNVYVAGDFRAKRTDQGGDVGPLDNGFGSQSGLVQLDASGAIVQTYRLGGYLDGDDQSLAIDSAGSVFIAGRLWGTADYDPGPNQYSLTAADYGSYSLTKLAAPRTSTPPSTPPTSGIPTAIVPTGTTPTTTTVVPDPVPAPAPTPTPTITLTKSDGFSDDRRYFTGLARLLREKIGAESSWKFVSNDTPGFDLDELAPTVSTKPRNGDRNALPANMLWLLELEDENLLLNPAMGEGDQSVAIIERLLRDHARRKNHPQADTADSTPTNASPQRPSSLSNAGYEELVDEVMSRTPQPAGSAP